MPSTLWRAAPTRLPSINLCHVPGPSRQLVRWCSLESSHGSLWGKGSWRSSKSVIALVASVPESFFVAPTCGVPLLALSVFDSAGSSELALGVNFHSCTDSKTECDVDWGA